MKAHIHVQINYRERQGERGQIQTHLLIQFLQEKEDMDFAMRERPCVVEVRTYDAV